MTSALVMFLLWVPAISLAAQECVWVVGNVVCEKNPDKQVNVEVRVIDRDSVFPFNLVDPDDLMGVTFTNEEGRFQLDGCANDVDWIPGLIKNLPEPYIRIRHYCNKEEGETLELEEFKVFVPNSYELGTVILDTQKSATPTPRKQKTNI